MADAIGYIRVSTDEQAREGESLGAQRARLEAAAAAAGDRMIDVLGDDGRSAKTMKRPGLQEALARLRAGEASTLWATKLDRVTRRPADLEFMLERHFDEAGPHVLRLANEPYDSKAPTGELMLRIQCAIAWHELRQVSQRTQTALEHKRSEGRVVGALPLGFDRDGDKLVPNAGEQAIVARAQELRAAGAGYHSIARTLADEGHKTKRGGSWRACTIQKLLARAAQAEVPPCTARRGKASATREGRRACLGDEDKRAKPDGHPFPHRSLGNEDARERKRRPARPGRGHRGAGRHR